MTIVVLFSFQSWDSHTHLVFKLNIIVSDTSSFVPKDRLLVFIATFFPVNLIHAVKPNAKRANSTACRTFLIIAIRTKNSHTPWIFRVRDFDLAHEFFLLDFIIVLHSRLVYKILEIYDHYWSYLTKILYFSNTEKYS